MTTTISKIELCSDTTLFGVFGDERTLELQDTRAAHKADLTGKEW